MLLNLAIIGIVPGAIGDGVPVARRRRDDFDDVLVAVARRLDRVVPSPVLEQRRLGARAVRRHQRYAARLEVDRNVARAAIADAAGLLLLRREPIYG